MGPKKVPFTPFKTRARARSIAPPADAREDMMGAGEFRDTEVSFSPAIPRADVSLTISFRCSARLVRGDTITIKLAGFKGPTPTLFCVEAREYQGQLLDFRDKFHAYWSGESPPKGGPPGQSIILQVRDDIEDTTTPVVIGVPDTVHICLPEKLGANSAKLKIEGMVRHSNGPGPVGKIPKAAVAACPEVKKKSVDDDLIILEQAVKAVVENPQLNLLEDEVQYALETTQQDADHVWEAVREVSELKIGLNWRMETGVWGEYKECSPVAQTIVECYREASKRIHPLALHREIAKNLGVKVGMVVMLEDALFMLHGAHYQDHSRASLLVLRLFTMEPHDINRLLRVVSAPSMQREIVSALRTCNRELISKWALSIAVLMYSTKTLPLATHDHVPAVFRGVKELPGEAIQRLLALKRDTIYGFPNFTTWVADAKFNDENYTAPDSAVIFEMRTVAEALELGDVSQYPENRDWLLPAFSAGQVVSVEQYPEKNNLVHVVLRYSGSLAGKPRETSFAESDREKLTSVVKNVKNIMNTSAAHSHALARLVFANIRLNDLKAMHPAHVVHRQYLDKFSDVARASIAKQLVEEGRVRWQAAKEPYVAGEVVNLRQLTWEPLHRKHQATVEALFLKRTRVVKELTADGVTVDFKEYTVDFGKGAQRMRRVVEKHVSHPYGS